MMGFGWLWFIVVVVVLLYFLNSNNIQKKEDEPSSARDILDKRYANGEIDEEEYKRMRENLQ